MEWVGKAVRKEIEGVGLCSGTVRSHDSSRNFENGVTEVSESADLAMGEGGSQCFQKGPETKPNNYMNQDLI